MHESTLKKLESKKVKDTRHTSYWDNYDNSYINSIIFIIIIPNNIF